MSDNQRPDPIWSNFYAPLTEDEREHVRVYMMTARERACPLDGTWLKQEAYDYAKALLDAEEESE